MRLPIYQVDAFASEVFAGNPAAVVVASEGLDAALMQQIAAENNLSETAFITPSGRGYAIRWFTPATEVDLCGHATMAAALVAFAELAHPGERVVFSSHLSGELAVARLGSELALDFPARPPRPVDPHPDLLPSLGGVAPLEVLAANDYLVVYEHPAQVAALAPEMRGLARLDRGGVIVTAPGGGRHGGADFVSRCFAPAEGIDEDPVTGSAHCTLGPYWGARLGRDEMAARQISARGGELGVRLRGERVEITGRAVLYLKGEITL